MFKTLASNETDQLSIYEKACQESLLPARDKESHPGEQMTVKPGVLLKCFPNSLGPKRWTVTKGAGKVIFNERSMILHTGETITIPAKTEWQIHNSTLELLVFNETSPDEKAMRLIS